MKSLGLSAVVLALFTCTASAGCDGKVCTLEDRSFDVSLFGEGIVRRFPIQEHIPTPSTRLSLNFDPCERIEFGDAGVKIKGKNVRDLTKEEIVYALEQVARVPVPDNPLDVCKDKP